MCVRYAFSRKQHIAMKEWSNFDKFGITRCGSGGSGITHRMLHLIAVTTHRILHLIALLLIAPQLIAL